jgi:hypothetical protein
MSDSPADAPALAPQTQTGGWPSESKPPGEGWTRNKFIFLVTFVLALHVALIFIFGTKKQIVPRAVTKVPHLRLADTANELIALRDPTLFARPNAHDFVTAFWRRPPPIRQALFNWTEAPRFLLPAPEQFGAAFREFMKTNPPPETPSDFKPEPKLIQPVVAFDDAMPQKTTMQISGELAQRRLLGQIEFTTNNGTITITGYTPARGMATIPAATDGLPAIPVNDVLEPSKVQALVGTSGAVVSIVLLQASGLELADSSALALARNLRFAPAPRLMFGEITFNWHTVPTNEP